jgi:PAS domain-containing protein
MGAEMVCKAQESLTINEAETGTVEMLRASTQGPEANQTSVLLSRVVEQIADSVILTDTRGVIQYVNPAFEVTSGYGEKKPWAKLLGF